MRVIARSDSGIKELKQLRDRPVGTPSINGVIHIATLYGLKQDGVDPKSVRFIEMTFPNMPDQLKAGRVDAVEVVEPFVTALLKAGHVDIGAPMLKVNDPAVLTCWMASGSWARANRDIVARWVKSLTEARTFIKDNNAQARAVLKKWTKLPDAVVENIVLPTYDTALTARDVAVWIDATVAVGEMSESLDAKKLVLQ